MFRICLFFLGIIKIIGLTRLKLFLEKGHVILSAQGSGSLYQKIISLTTFDRTPYDRKVG
jgi:maltodextrin utilization protein YvdJ